MKVLVTTPVSMCRWKDMLPSTTCTCVRRSLFNFVHVGSGRGRWRWRRSHNRLLRFGAPGGDIAGRLLRHVHREFKTAPAGQTALPKVQCTGVGCSASSAGGLYGGVFM